MTIQLNTEGLTKNQIYGKLYEIIYECKILRKTTHGYLVKYNNYEKTEYLLYKDMKDRLHNMKNLIICL